MIGVRVAIVRFVSDEPQPGVVECELVDANGRKWHFMEKSAIVSAEMLSADSEYPQPRIIAIEELERSSASGREVVTINTERPWCVESVEGVTNFSVLPEQIVPVRL